MEDSIMDEKLLKPAEVAEILQISKAKAYALLQQGVITTVRIGTLVRVKRSDLDRYILESTRMKVSANN
jgi:excisionase family DNA binding protein